MKSIAQGASGSDVKLLQRALEELMFDVGRVDGIFGMKTERAVRDFQESADLVVDGIVGPKTWAAIVARATSTTVDPPADTLPPPAPSVRLAGHLAPIDRCWPIRALRDGRKPVITSRFRERNPSRPTHNGCDFFFAYDSGDPPMKSGDGGRAGKWWIPPGTFAVAQADGVIELAGKGATGFRVWIRHGPVGALATGFFHLTGILPGIAPGAFVRMGDPIGPIGDNPIDHDAVHLHAELYRGPLAHYPAGSLDPEIFLSGARVLPALP